MKLRPFLTLLPRAVGTVLVLVVMTGYMVKHMVDNKRASGVFWDDTD